MSTKEINGSLLRSLLISGYTNLENEKKHINSLNVFPVPDGDTGINMAKTMEGGVSAPESENVSDYMKAFSKKSLLSARGNSGVILSQFIRGFAKGVKDKNSIDPEGFAAAFNTGVECAYDAVIKPVEGTMLTVLRESGEFLAQNASQFDDFETCFPKLCEKTEESLQKTPDKLPILKEAGVVDSGGAGILCIFRGMTAALLDECIKPLFKEDESTEPTTELPDRLGPDFVFEYGYCTEFILQLQNAKCNVESFDISPLSEFLQTIGDSIVAICDGDIVKVHIHTKTPEAAIGKAREYGELLTVKIENMSLQHSQTETEKKEERKKYAVVAVASGEGLIRYFSEIGVSAFVNGGQTNNPSANDFIKTFKACNADHVIVLPNNSNILLTAQQAAKMYKDGAVHVIPTKSVAECYSAISMMDLTVETAEELIEGMSAYLPYVTSGYVTVATRDVTINGIEVKEGKYIGLDNDNILSCSSNKIDCAMELFNNLEDIEDKGVITVFYGKNVTKEEVSSLKNRLRAELPDIETGFVDGGQDVYDFIFSIE